MLEGSHKGQSCPIKIEANQLARSAPFSLEGEGLGMRVVGVGMDSSKFSITCFPPPQIEAESTINKISDSGYNLDRSMRGSFNIPK